MIKPEKLAEIRELLRKILVLKNSGYVSEWRDFRFPDVYGNGDCMCVTPVRVGNPESCELLFRLGDLILEEDDENYNVLSCLEEGTSPFA